MTLDVHSHNFGSLSLPQVKKNNTIIKKNHKTPVEFTTYLKHSVVKNSKTSLREA